MVRSINEIGHLTGKQTIAEFAENAEIINMLRSIGVDYAQGYGIAMPQRIVKVATGDLISPSRASCSAHLARAFVRERPVLRHGSG
jgi:EAL domain-containing protein (putative c-di-GMP-specific phosphodiesterase class I)